MISENFYQFILRNFQDKSIFDGWTLSLLAAIVWAIAGLFMLYCVYKDHQATPNMPEREHMSAYMIVILFFFVPVWKLGKMHYENSVSKSERFYQRVSLQMKKVQNLSVTDAQALEKIFKEGIKQKEDGTTEYDLAPVHQFLNQYNREQPAKPEIKPNIYLTEVESWVKQKEKEAQARQTTESNATSEIKPLSFVDEEMKKLPEVSVLKENLTVLTATEKTTKLKEKLPKSTPEKGKLTGKKMLGKPKAKQKPLSSRKSSEKRTKCRQKIGKSRGRINRIVASDYECRCECFR